MIFFSSSNVNFRLPTTFFKYLLHKAISRSQKSPCHGAFDKLKSHDIPLLEQNVCVSSAENTFALSEITPLAHPCLAIDVRKLLIRIFVLPS